ncbi:hypothetical protein [Halegenticoccus tardaugens]|uniref:hypothetical protein n=1 Tax=Halegenticoccus tardaugens TaxID=2071624 RepID=UPI0013E918F7|nr:hypothetical protein [Halegenticoccus tardaugens]
MVEPFIEIDTENENFESMRAIQELSPETLAGEVTTVIGPTEPGRRRGFGES